MGQGGLPNSSNHLLSNQTDHPQAFRTAGVLGTSECTVLDPDLLRFDVHVFPHFSRCAVCFGDPTEVECGDVGQGAQHILPVGKTQAGGQPPLEDPFPPPPVTPVSPDCKEWRDLSLEETGFILTGKQEMPKAFSSFPRSKQSRRMVLGL